MITMPNNTEAVFSNQNDIRAPWRRYLDDLEPIRPDLFRYCRQLTGNIWEAEDLVQDALLRVFSLLGKIDADLENPKAYLIKTATNLWIDRVRRHARESAILEMSKLSESDKVAVNTGAQAVDSRKAASILIQKLHPQERAAVVLKDILDLSLIDTASILNTSVGAIKSALHRGRLRLEQGSEPANFVVPDKTLVEQFMVALRDTDLESLKKVCVSDLAVELVGGAELHSFEESQIFFQHAHFVMPEMGFGESPWWELTEYQGEPIVIGYRTLYGVEGINEVHRIEELGGKITRVRCYCFCPDTLRAIAEELGKESLARPYRSPSAQDYDK